MPRSRSPRAPSRAPARAALLALSLCAACGSGGAVGPLCAVPDMAQLYSGLLPPNPYGSGVPAAGSCYAAHDAIILLGCPSNADGTASGCQIARADLALVAAQKGLGARYIVSGGAAHNQYVEADSLRKLLLDRGVAADQIFREPQAMHTDENIYYSTRIMQAQGWTSAIVLSDDPGHLILTAVCDSNCCVDLGRLTVMDFDALRAGHYQLFPQAEAVSTGECGAIEKTLKAMCTQLSSRLSCKADFKL